MGSVYQDVEKPGKEKDFRYDIMPAQPMVSYLLKTRYLLPVLISLIVLTNNLTKCASYDSLELCAHWSMFPPGTYIGWDRGKSSYWP